MKLKCMILAQDNDLSSRVAEYIKKNVTLELLTTSDVPLDIALKKLTSIDVLFFEVSEDSDIDFERVLSISHMYKSLVLIINRSDYTFESHIHSDIDYLFSPFNLLEFDLLIKRIQKKVGIINISESFKPSYFYCQNEEDLSETVKCFYKDITIIEAQNKSLKIHIEGKGVLLTPISLKRMLLETQGMGAFIRVHRSYLINSERIEGIKGNYVKVSGYQGSVKIGVTFYKGFMEYINLKRI